MGESGEHTVTADDRTVLIEIDGLTKRFGSFTAVDHVSFNVARGEASRKQATST